jgi:hypothetical protein
MPFQLGLGLLGRLLAEVHLMPDIFQRGLHPAVHQRQAQGHNQQGKTTGLGERALEGDFEGNLKAI